jgi:prevent-host-death family protein
MTSTVKAEEARNKFSDIVNRAAFGHERIVVTRHGKGVAAVVPMEDLRLIEQLVEKIEDFIDTEEAKAALREAETGGTIPFEQVKADLGI